METIFDPNFKPRESHWVRVAWLERYVISVFVHRHAPDWPVTVILRRAPRRHGR